MKKFIKCLVLLCNFAVLFVACSSVSASPTAELPDWVLRTPEADALYEYFVASGTDFDLSEAEAKANAALVTEISRYLGTYITASSELELSGEIDKLEKRINNQLQQSSNAKLESLKITEKYFVETQAGTTIYLLARYDKAALAQEKRRLEQLVGERNDSVTQAEKRGEKAFSDGSFFLSGQYFIEAACNAKLNRVENAELYFNRNIARAQKSFSAITLTVQEISDALLIQSNDTGLIVTVLYFAKLQSARERLVKEKHALENGSYDFPISAALCSSLLYIQIASDGLFDKLDTCGKDGRLAKKTLESIIRDKQQTIRLKSFRSADVQKRSISVVIDKTADLKPELLQAVQKSLLAAGYAVQKTDSAYTVEITFHCGTPQADGNTFLTDCTMNFNLFSGNELIKADTIHKTSVGFSEAQSRSGTVKLAAEALAQLLSDK